MSTCNANEKPTEKHFCELNTLSELLEIALRDFEQVCKVDSFRVDMGLWLINSRAEEHICYGCLAGAVLYQEKLVDTNDGYIDVTPSGMNFKVGMRMRAINKLRTGFLQEAAKIMHIETPHELASTKIWRWWFPVNEYNDDLTKQENFDGPFGDALRKLLAYLKENGL